MNYFKDNNAKEKILESIAIILREENVVAEYKIDFHELSKKCNLEYERLVKNINYLCAENYIIISDSVNNTCKIQITQNGISAANSNYFKNKNSRAYFNLLKEGIAISINIIIAVAAVCALNRDTTNEMKEISALKTRLDSMSLLLEKEQYINMREGRVGLLLSDTLKVSLIKNK